MAEAVCWRYSTIDGNPMFGIGGYSEPGQLWDREAESSERQAPNRLVWRASLAAAIGDVIELTGAQVNEYRRTGGLNLFRQNTEHLIGDLEDAYRRHPARFDQVLRSAQEKVTEDVVSALRDAQQKQDENLSERLKGAFRWGAAAAVPAALQLAAVPPFAVALVAVAGASAAGAHAENARVRTPYLGTNLPR